jgi:X-Pro dipeptidyl-peptidase
VSLPVVGGYDGLVAAGALEADTVAPVFAAPPGDIDLTVADPSGAVVTFPLPAATDNEDPSPEVVCDHAPGSRFPVGSTLVTCTATDASGNSARTTFTVLLRGALPIGGNVPATLSLTLGAPATFGAFTPGVAREYTASTTANVISSAGDARLTVSDPSTIAPGHLVNGAFSLPQPLQGLGVVKTYAGPVSNDAVTVTFKQAIGASDALRTGTYSKTLTFTLSTTAP